MRGGWLLVLVVTSLAGACSARKSISDETTGTNTTGTNTTGTTNEPGDGGDGEEPVFDVGGGSTGPFPWDVGPDDECEPSPGPYACCREWDSSQCGNGGGYGFSNACVMGCVCSEPCSVDADCPLPTTGNVTPRCSNEDCRLPCSEGIECPDGMSCEPPGEEGAECYWILEYPETYECWWGRDPDVCAQHETREQCEADLEGDPPWGCIWVSETIFAAGTVTCDPQGTTERCIPAERDEAAGCEDERRCAPTRPAVYWTDLGAGTASLLEVEPCAYVPSYDKYTDRTYEPCLIGDPSIPLVCDCACE